MNNQTEQPVFTVMTTYKSYEDFIKKVNSLYPNCKNVVFNEKRDDKGFVYGGDIFYFNEPGGINKGVAAWYIEKGGGVIESNRDGSAVTADISA